jgi:hypothetical protein
MSGKIPMSRQTAALSAFTSRNFPVFPGNFPHGARKSEREKKGNTL